MMTDIRNLQAFALYLEKTDIKFDLFSITKEIEKQVYNFNFFCCPISKEFFVTVTVIIILVDQARLTI